MDLRAAVALQIKVELTGKQMTQRELAEKAGVTRETLNNYLQCKRDMTLITFARVSEALGLKPDALLGRAAERVSL